MVGNKCSMANCQNRFNKCGPNVSFHQFPANVKRRKLWVEACRRGDSLNPNTARVCSDHFLLDDFESNLMAEYGFKRKKVLKRDAVPTQNLPQEGTPRTPSSRIIRQNHWSRNQIVTTFLSEQSASTIENGSAPSTSLVNALSPKAPVPDKICDKSDLDRLQHTAEIKHLQDQVIQLQKRLVEETKLKENALAALSKAFNTAQINLVLPLEKQPKSWTSEDLSIAFALLQMSQRCYIFLRQNYDCPLPSISTLQRWAANISIRPGMFHDFLNIIKVTSNISPLQRVCVISFGEMKVTKSYEYDKLSNEVVGPYSHMQVLMARGLFSDWKQPVFIDFDKKIDGQLLSTVIKALQESDLDVVAVVWPLTGNATVFEDLGATHTNPSFKVNGRTIHRFENTPQLLLLIRNHFLDSGFELVDGTRISSEPIRRLIREKKVSPFKLGQHHISEKHRQNALFAAELMSHTTATTLIDYLSNDEEARATADFISKVSLWFDIFNSRPGETILPKSAFGVHLNEQTQFLDNFNRYVSNMRVCGIKSLLTFQSSIIMNSVSLKALFTDMKLRYDIKWIFGYKLDQDVLRNFFFQINEDLGDPTPLSCLGRIKMLLLGKSPEKSHINTSDEKFLVDLVIKRTSSRSVQEESEIHVEIE